eukprot:125882-Pyramimonas_sp.AAC.2
MIVEAPWGPLGGLLEPSWGPLGPQSPLQEGPRGPPEGGDWVSGVRRSNRADPGSQDGLKRAPPRGLQEGPKRAQEVPQ